MIKLDVFEKLLAMNVIPKLILIVVAVSSVSAVSMLQKESVTCETGSYPPPSTEKVEWLTVDLDLPPDQRWNQVIKAKTAELRNLINVFKRFVTEVSGGSTIVIEIVDKYLTPIVDTFPYPFADELRGIARASGIPLGEVIFYNVVYEISSLCTSIISEDSRGKLYHARNLDFGLFLGWDVRNHSWYITEALRPAIVNLDFRRGNKTVFLATNFAGYVGVLTGMKPRSFTLTVNRRFDFRDGGILGIVDWILGDRQSEWLGFITRRVLENGTSYQNARRELSNKPILAPVYFILGGNKTKQGCVITRARDKAVDVWQMHGKAVDNWFILETNYDHWEKPLFLDDRRTPANICMRRMGQQNVGFEGVFNVLSTKPVRNKLTTYTTLMQVNSARYETYLQYCPDPCVPW